MPYVRKWDSQSRSGTSFKYGGESLQMKHREFKPEANKRRCGRRGPELLRPCFKGTSCSALTSRELQGFTLIELLVALAIGMIITAASLPVLGSVMSRMRVNSAVTSISTTIAKTRYRSIRNSDIYTL